MAAKAPQGIPNSPHSWAVTASGVWFRTARYVLFRFRYRPLSRAVQPMHFPRLSRLREKMCPEKRISGPRYSRACPPSSARASGRTEKLNCRAQSR